VVSSNVNTVTVFSVCQVSLQSFDITPPKSFLSIIIIIILLWHTGVKYKTLVVFLIRTNLINDNDNHT